MHLVLGIAVVKAFYLMAYAILNTSTWTTHRAWAGTIDMILRW